MDRSLYSSRAYASKNPNLSPIRERLSLVSQTPSVSCTGKTFMQRLTQKFMDICSSDIRWGKTKPDMFSFLPTDPAHETNMNHKRTKDSQTIGDPTVANALENPPEDSITSSSKESATGEDGGLSGASVGKRRLRKRKVSVAHDILLTEEPPDQTGGGKLDERCEDQTASDREASRETPLTHAVPETSAEAHGSDSDGKLEHHGSLDSPTPDCPPSGEGSNDTLKLPGQRKAKLRRRSSVSQEHQTSREVEEKEQGDQLENIASSSDSQTEGGAARLDLAPWQADFNFEDVFKPVATRGRRSVRRSLRNQNTAESSSSVGLAWLPRTSPDSSKEARRRTRVRRLSAAPPVHQDDTS